MTEWKKIKEEIPAEENRVIIMRQKEDKEFIKEYNLKGDRLYDYMIGFLENGLFQHGGFFGSMSDKDLSSDLWKEWEWRYLNG